MNKILASFLALIGLSTQSVAQEANAQNAGMSLELREMVFSVTPKQIGIDQKAFGHEVWGLVMETGMDGGSYTLVVLADGTTSMYFSNGGGVIGAGEHEKVRAAGGALLGAANQYFREGTPTKMHPLPKDGNTNFYFLTFHGVLAYTAKEVELGEGRDKLSNLFYAGHAVIAEVRQSSGG